MTIVTAVVIIVFVSVNVKAEKCQLCCV